jgi:hypothetical protein
MMNQLKGVTFPGNSGVRSAMKLKTQNVLSKSAKECGIRDASHLRSNGVIIPVQQQLTKPNKILRFDANIFEPG